MKSVSRFDFIKTADIFCFCIIHNDYYILVLMKYLKKIF